MGFKDKFIQLLKPDDDAHSVDPDRYGDHSFERLYLHCQNFTYKWRKPLIAFGVLNVSLFALAIFITIIKYTVEGSHLNTSSLEFSLYKNSFYGSCSNSTSRECELRNGRSIAALNETNILHWSNVVSREAFCSCFQDTKVIPSAPRQSAFGYNGREEWLPQTMTLATGLWTFLEMFQMEETCQDCLNEENRISKHTYALFCYDVVQFIMWWVGFGRLASYPANQSPVAIMSWITPWRYMFSLAAPPLKGRLANERDRRSTFSTSLRSLLWFSGLRQLLSLV